MPFGGLLPLAIKFHTQKEGGLKKTIYFWELDEIQNNKKKTTNHPFDHFPPFSPKYSLQFKKKVITISPKNGELS